MIRPCQLLYKTATRNVWFPDSARARLRPHWISLVAFPTLSTMRVRLLQRSARRHMQLRAIASIHVKRCGIYRSVRAKLIKPRYTNIVGARWCPTGTSYNFLAFAPSQNAARLNLSCITTKCYVYSKWHAQHAFIRRDREPNGTGAPQSIVIWCIIEIKGRRHDLRAILKCK